jgi:flagellar biosynthetic protein FlhB
MKKIKMSKKEVKDELKKTEGDPLVKSRIRSIQMEMARRRMMQEVPKADVVITNPTHLAVAIKYDNTIMTAPRVLAKGAGEVARRIRAVAEEHHVPILEDKEVARSLYASVELGQEIPADLYEAVAQILAHIYKLKGNHPQGLLGSRG